MNITKKWFSRETKINGEGKDILFLFEDENGDHVSGNGRTCWEKWMVFGSIPLEKREEFLKELIGLHKKYVPNAETHKN